MDPREDLLQTTVPDPSAAWWHLPAWLPVRALQSRHRERVLTHLLALNETDRHRRFGQLATDEQIRGYVEGIDFARDQLSGVFDARLRLLAVAHLAYGDTAAAGAGGPPIAEFGVSVLPRGRGRGLGRRLFERSVLDARNRGIRTLVVHLARDNAPMLAIVRRSGATVRHEGGDAIAHLALPDADLRSQLGARAEQGFAELDYRLKRLFARA